MLRNYAWLVTINRLTTKWLGTAWQLNKNWQRSRVPSIKLIKLQGQLFQAGANESYHFQNLGISLEKKKCYFDIYAVHDILPISFIINTPPYYFGSVGLK